jgi:hypothetical protein
LRNIFFSSNVRSLFTICSSSSSSSSSRCKASQ